MNISYPDPCDNKSSETTNLRDTKKTVWKPVDLSNDDNAFVHYFGPSGLNLLKLLNRPEEEWNIMLTCLKKPLPSTFRITPCGNFQKRTLRSINNMVNKISSTTIYPVIEEGSGEILATSPPYKIGQWCPDGWNTCTYRAGLRLNENLREFHQFLVRATETGAIARQEMVSMIPAILLNVKPGLNGWGNDSK
jgi:16S rRNA C967 or C1407 C5-methylase (RsmB/RsmF family)